MIVIDAATCARDFFTSGNNVCTNKAATLSATQERITRTTSARVWPSNELFESRALTLEEQELPYRVRIYVCMYVRSEQFKLWPHAGQLKYARAVTWPMLFLFYARPPRRARNARYFAPRAIQKRNGELGFYRGIPNSTALSYQIS